MLDISELRAEQSRLENKQQNFLQNFVKMPDGEGTVVVRLLPPKPGKRLYCVTRTHRLGNKTFHSPMNLINGRWEGYCPIYSHYKKLYQEADKTSGQAKEAILAEIKAIKPNERYYYNCIVRYYQTAQTGIVKATDNTTKILSIGKQLHARIIRAILGDPNFDEPELGDVTSVQTGRDLKIIKKIRKSGTEAYPNYDESKFLAPSPLGTEQEVKMWTSQSHDLDALRNIKPVEELKKELDIYLGLIQETEGSSQAPPSAPASVHHEEETGTAIEEDEFIASLRRMRQGS